MKYHFAFHVYDTLCNTEQMKGSNEEMATLVRCDRDVRAWERNNFVRYDLESCSVECILCGYV